MNYLCVHAHFYQPPRENPWLEAVEGQESAEPYHDWNQRITAECYAPNSRSRILDDSGFIARLVNNYSRISFNVGPTLLSWLEQFDRATYEAILEADRVGSERFAGHGPAMAQVYNHAIMPLANSRDQRTQVAWGLADFERRFQRRPEGMWLAEAAADLATLEVLAEFGIAFTVLSPHQAACVRKGPNDVWIDVRGGRVDPTQPYTVHLPSGRSLAVFFYDGPVSQAIAFERLLTSGERLASRLLGAIPDRPGPLLMHVATDGETYGHHVPFGDMALAFALDTIERGGQARLTVYGEYLATAPPTSEVQIIEPSSWSCSHGVERWRGDCGCKTGGEPGWSQAWRAPLRSALDGLRDRLAVVYETRAGEILRDAWAARDDYASVILDRRPATIAEFLSRHASVELSDNVSVAALSLLEMQRHCLLMFTSCGWFFDEVSGIETVQILAYAARAIQLAESLGERNVEKAFLLELTKAKSNHVIRGDGRAIYESICRPMMVGLAQVAAHVAIVSLFDDEGPKDAVYCFDVAATNWRRLDRDDARLAVGELRIVSRLTGESSTLFAAATHLGELNLRAGVRRTNDPICESKLIEAFRQGDFAELLRILDDDYSAGRFSLSAVFQDERRRLMARMLNPTALAMEAMFRRLVDEHSSTMMVVQGLDTPILPAFRNAARFVIENDLRRAFARDEPDFAAIATAAEEAAAWELTPSPGALNFSAQSAMARCVERLRQSPDDPGLVKDCARLLDYLTDLKLTPDLWQAQNVVYELVYSAHPHQSSDMKLLIASLARRLRVRIP